MVCSLSFPFSFEGLEFAVLSMLLRLADVPQFQLAFLHSLPLPIGLLLVPFVQFDLVSVLLPLSMLLFLLVVLWVALGDDDFESVPLPLVRLPTNYFLVIVWYVPCSSFVSIVLPWKEMGLLFGCPSFVVVVVSWMWMVP